MQRANSNKKNQKGKGKGPTKAQNIGEKRPRSAMVVPVSNPVRGMKAKSEVTERKKDATRMCIVQPLCDVSNLVGATQGNVLVTSTLATLNQNLIPLCPSQLNGSVQAEAQIWTNYKIHGLKFHYIPTCPTTTSGALCFGTSDSPAAIATLDITSFSTARSARNAVTTSVYQPLSWTVKLNQDDSILRVNDSGSIALSTAITDKLVYNKVFFGRTDIAAPATTAISYGFINVELDIEFQQLVTSQGFSLTASTMEEKMVLISIRNTLFPKVVQASITPEPVDGVSFLLSRLGLKKDSDAASVGSVRSWVSGGR